MAHTTILLPGSDFLQRPQFFSESLQVSVRPHRTVGFVERVLQAGCASGHRTKSVKIPNRRKKIVIVVGETKCLATTTNSLHVGRYESERLTTLLVLVSIRSSRILRRKGPSLRPAVNSS